MTCPRCHRRHCVCLRGVGWVIAVLAALAVWATVAAQPPAEGAMGRGDAPPVVGMSGACPGFVLASGVFDGAEHEIADQGFFSLGGAGVSFRPETPAWYRARELRGQALELVLRPVRCRELERIDR